MGKTVAATVKGSVFYPDEVTSYNDVRRHGKYVPVDHQETFGVGAAHINGIEGFWHFAERLHRQVHGVDRDHFPLYLAEYEVRYNHRGRPPARHSVRGSDPTPTPKGRAGLESC